MRREAMMARRLAMETERYMFPVLWRDRTEMVESR